MTLRHPDAVGDLDRRHDGRGHPSPPTEILDSLVIGGGQAGVATSFFLQQRGVAHLVLDTNSAPGGAWQHRWESLTMDDVHGVADLPGAPAPRRSNRPANQVVPAFFADYERRHGLPVIRPVHVTGVVAAGDLLVVRAGEHHWRTRTLVNASGTWTHPFVPYYPGIASFVGEQFHTAGFPGAGHLRSKRVLVVGGGASAVQHLGEIAPVTDTLWVTRRPPVWREDEFDAEAGLAAVTQVEARIRDGRPPASVVSVTGLTLRAQERRAAELGAYVRRPMFSAIEPHGVRWVDGSFEAVDVILWATGFRPALDHLAPLGLRSPRGGIALTHIPGNVQGATTAVRDPRVQLVGYGPSASTLGASRAARAAAAAVQRHLRRAATASGS
jgi:thioredoxin reductase